MSEVSVLGDGDVKRRHAAERQRHSRTRRATGGVLVHFELSAGGIAVLVDLGWLTDADRHNPRAVRDAFVRFVNKAVAAVLTEALRMSGTDDRGPSGNYPDKKRPTADLGQRLAPPPPRSDHL